MWGHLKAEEFITLIEGGSLTSRSRAHLEACPQCQKSKESVEGAYTMVANTDASVPEPDWSEFRTSVRDEMLSRSVQRQTAIRRWTGWSLRPALAWSLTIMIAVGVTAGAFIWNGNRTETAPVVSVVEAPASTGVDSTAFENRGFEEELSVWSNKTVFDELATLESEEEESLLQLLATEGPNSFQEQ